MVKILLSIYIKRKYGENAGKILVTCFNHDWKKKSANNYICSVIL